MADILIRGMKMPDSCEFCRFHGYGGYEFERVVCSLTGRSKEKPIFSRFDDCPFIGIPPHGDLILKDDAIVAVKLLSDLYPEYRKILAVLWDQIKDLTVIIPESEEVTNDPQP